MHEFGLAERLLEAVLDEVGKSGEHVVRVVKVTVGKGPFAVVSEEELKFCYQIVAKGTPAEKSKLDISDIPAEIECSQCGGKDGVVGSPENTSKIVCSECGSTSLEIHNARQTVVSSIEFEVSG